MLTFDASIPRKLQPNLEFLLRELTLVHKTQPRSILLYAWQNMLAVGCPFHCPFVAQDSKHIVAGEITSEFTSKWLLWGRRFVHTVEAVRIGPATSNNICPSMGFPAPVPDQWKKANPQIIDGGEDGLLYYEEERWQVVEDPLVEDDRRISSTIRGLVPVYLSRTKG